MAETTHKAGIYTQQKHHVTRTNKSYSQKCFDNTNEHCRCLLAADSILCRTNEWSQ